MTEIEDFEEFKKLIASIASHCVTKGKLTMVLYLKYKKDIMQSSNRENLKVIAHNLIEGVCG